MCLWAKFFFNKKKKKAAALGLTLKTKLSVNPKVKKYAFLTDYESSLGPGLYVSAVTAMEVPLSEDTAHPYGECPPYLWVLCKQKSSC